LHRVWYTKGTLDWHLNVQKPLVENVPFIFQANSYLLQLGFLAWLHNLPTSLGITHVLYITFYSFSHVVYIGNATHQEFCQTNASSSSSTLLVNVFFHKIPSFSSIALYNAMYVSLHHLLVFLCFDVYMGYGWIAL